MNNIRLFIDDKEYPTNCFVVAFSKLLCGLLSEHNQTIKDTGGTDRTVGHGIDSGDNCNIMGEVGESDQGIVVGTGTNSVAKDDYCLQTQINHGTGSGELQYDAQIVNAYITPNLSSGYLEINISRSFTNSSGASITINEVGIITKKYNHFLIARDIISGGHVVLNNSSCVVKYLIKVEI